MRAGELFIRISKTIKRPSRISTRELKLTLPTLKYTTSEVSLKSNWANWEKPTTRKLLMISFMLKNLAPKMLAFLKESERLIDCSKTMTKLFII